MCLSNPAHGASCWITEKSRKEIEKYMNKNFGAVRAHASWPLLRRDVQLVFEKLPPKDMTDLSSE